MRLKTMQTDIIKKTLQLTSSTNNRPIKSNRLWWSPANVDKTIFRRNKAGSYRPLLAAGSRPRLDGGHWVWRLACGRRTEGCCGWCMETSGSACGRTEPWPPWPSRRWPAPEVKVVAVKTGKWEEVTTSWSLVGAGVSHHALEHQRLGNGPKPPYKLLDLWGARWRFGNVLDDQQGGPRYRREVLLLGVHKSRQRKKRSTVIWKAATTVTKNITWRHHRMSPKKGSGPKNIVPSGQFLSRSRSEMPKFCLRAL